MQKAYLDSMHNLQYACIKLEKVRTNMITNNYDTNP